MEGKSEYMCKCVCMCVLVLVCNFVCVCGCVRVLVCDCERVRVLHEVSLIGVTTFGAFSQEKWF